ncbi:hypothetical protein Desaci_0450 [Desulfosporosinus acidiphilus SJ4]|uniref:DUF4474 domain-containing protein n=1 Tax=Desulfosporosinus acidiphilus (strain DSM 22704 / JCM 16185 / SJ4) TaxID=646529 RepID=I4D143_DESAJ|nr:DUF4474 domain-containing protein [Desulfosporosinus acidiphilus]AFM39517.1 hypothetical protein Desaci_0450 [Desulfosporosinus acidiphilus SJ4]
MPELLTISNSGTFPWESYDKLRNLSDETGDKTLDELIEISGYSYDPVQDIFYSNMDPWQRKMGYCRLFDEAAAPMGMIVDCEPIFFNYNDKQWMIGFWKGQYDLVSGAEIGVYTRTLNGNPLRNIFGAYYQSANDDELLQMSFTLKKNGKVFFSRQDKHWWLTGFKLGEFSQPSELSMTIKLTLNNTIMRDAFIDGLKAAGYSDEEFTYFGTTVGFNFDVPHTAQPITRAKTLEWIIQWKNEQLCKEFQEITGSSTTVPEKIKVIEESAPELYKKVLRMGRFKPLYSMYQAILTAIVALIVIITGAVFSNIFL